MNKQKKFSFVVVIILFLASSQLFLPQIATYEISRLFFEKTDNRDWQVEVEAWPAVKLLGGYADKLELKKQGLLLEVSNINFFQDFSKGQIEVFWQEDDFETWLKDNQDFLEIKDIKFFPSDQIEITGELSDKKESFFEVLLAVSIWQEKLELELREKKTDLFLAGGLGIQRIISNLELAFNDIFFHNEVIWQAVEVEEGQLHLTGEIR